MLLRTASTIALLAGLLTAWIPAWAQKVRLATTLGDIVIEVDAEKAPKTTANFLRYVRDKHYDGTIFHRVIETFMIQGGGYRADLSERPTRPPIPLESENGLSNARGTIAMARTAVPDSATAQFFINVVDNPGLDKANARDGHGYAVFGKVVEGLDVVDKIKAVAVRENGQHRHFPVETVTLRRATIEP